MGPLDLFFGIAPLLVAAAVWMVMAAIKAIVSRVMGGKEKRKSNLWVTRVIMPALPPLLGFLIAMFIPVHPDSLVQFVDDPLRELSAWQGRAVYGVWGATCGQFSDYFYSKVKSLIEQATKKEGPEAS